MNMHDFVQGSDAWHQHRATHFNASDAPAMLGCSPYKTRSALLHETATGIVDAEIDPATARRFADGHRIEALARPLAEQIIGEELAPLVLADGKYSASFDGLTFEGDTAWECKTLNAALRDAIEQVKDVAGSLVGQLRAVAGDETVEKLLAQIPGAEHLVG